MGIQVMMANGLPLTPAGCLIRNLMRVVDMLPFMYGFAIVSVLMRRDARRPSATLPPAASSYIAIGRRRPAISVPASPSWLMATTRRQQTTSPCSAGACRSISAERNTATKAGQRGCWSPRKLGGGGGRLVGIVLACAFSGA